MVWNFVVQIVASLVLTAISYALSPKPRTEAPKAAGLDAFDCRRAEEGRPIPVVFGTVLAARPERRLGGDLKVDPIRRRGARSERDPHRPRRDIRAARLCFQGARPWFRRHGARLAVFPRRRTARRGVLAATGDALALRVIAEARSASLG